MFRNVADELGYLPGKACPTCRLEFGIGPWPLQFFDYRPHGACAGSKHANSQQCQHPGCYSSRCTGHMLTERTERDPLEKKIEHSFRRHGAQDGVSLPQMLARWNTTVKTLAAKYRQEYEHGTCPRESGFGCGRTWSSMPNGLRDMTFDRIDPTKPFLPHNVQVLCITCNNKKKRMPPELLAIRNRCWEIWDASPKLSMIEAFAMDPDTLFYAYDMV